MKKFFWGLVILMVGVLVGIGATSAFAQAPPAGTSGDVTAQMQQACVNGDYQAMQKLHNEYCGGANGTAGGMMNGAGGMMGNGQGMMGGAGGGGMMGGNGGRGMMGGY